jgi:hypothetical protein
MTEKKLIYRSKIAPVELYTNGNNQNFLYVNGRLRILTKDMPYASRRLKEFEDIYRYRSGRRM